MRRLPSDGFKGEIPRLAAEQLPPGHAALAKMARLYSGRLGPWKQPLSNGQMPKASSGTIKALFPADINGTNGGPYWLHWHAGEMTHERVDVAHGNVIGATTERLLFTGIGAPKVATLSDAVGAPVVGSAGQYPYRWSRLGCESPAAAPTVAVKDQAAEERTLVPVDNAGAESGTLFWTVESGSLSTVSGTDFPGLTPYAGSKVFSFGSAAASLVSQPVDASEFLQNQKMRLTWRQSRGSEGSKAGMSLRYLDDLGDEVGVSTSDVIATPTAFEWVERRLDPIMPAGTATIELCMHGERVGAGACDAFIDGIELELISASTTLDGSSFDGLERTENRGDSNMFKRLLIDNDNGNPKPSFRFECDSRIAWWRKDFGGLDSARIVVTSDVYPNGDNASILGLHLMCGQGGNGYALQIQAGRVVTLRERGSFDQIDGTVVKELYNGASFAGRWVRARVELTIRDTSRATGTLSLIDVQNGTVYFEGVAVTVPLNGSWWGWNYKSNDNGKYSWMDNFAFTATPPAPKRPDALSGTSYLFTFVNALGGESAPSPASDVIRRNDGDAMIVTTPTTVTDATFNVTHKRIYRLVGTTADWMLVDEIPLAQADYEDTKTDQQLTSLLEPTADWLPPPADGHSICSVASGITFILSGKDICPSPIGRPHAYPMKWRKPQKYRCVAAAAYDMDLIVATEGPPVIVQGDDPSALAAIDTEKPQGCVSARSLVVMQGIGVVYASPDGLTAVSRAGVRLLTEGLLTEKEWRALNPASILGVTHDGKYFGFYDTGTEQAGFMFDPVDKHWIRLNLHATAAAYNPLTDSLELVVGGDRQSWNAGASAAEYDYQSGEFVLGSAASFAVARVRVAGSTRFRLYYDGVVVLDRVCSDSKPFLLPAKVAHEKVQWRLTGTGEVLAPPAVAERMVDV